MKLTFVLFLLLIMLDSCKSEKEIAPTEIWSEGCVSFKPDSKGFLLSGICCEYVTVSKIKIKKDNSFVTPAKYFTYTGAGFQQSDVNVTGKISEDRKSLDLSFEGQGVSKTFALKSGGPTASCLCGCD
ncbi:hypothetical protein L0657_21035 [Dyadobacter sp. CY345]|uniref:hypothetical protein n=1 Tax=Dyadobacter sp. CY345 TaxID=2909335 RepID=UPI001F2EC446|nr:hypothetical protein [Dyadobacter sp. CY345]MCF2446457.1 hypothetical protein [Dyadobacter sp. CY345]